jgi:hypothetical protein
VHEVDGTSMSVRPAYGRRRTVSAVQALVPDEPVEAAVVVTRPWAFAFSILSAVLVAQVATAKVFKDVHHGVMLGVLLAVLLALLVAVAALRDRGSALHLGLQSATIAVTATRVLVLAGSAVSGRPERIVLVLDRTTVPVMRIEAAFDLRSVGVRQPSGEVVVLRVLHAWRGAARAALPIVVSPPLAHWEPDPHAPDRARLRTQDGWTDATIHLRDLDLARVDVAPLAGQHE